MIDIFLSIFLITLGNSEYLTEINIAPVLQYLGYFILIVSITYGYLKNKKNQYGKLTFFIIVIILFNIGICFQDLDINIKIRLIFTMVVIASVAIFSADFVDSYKKINIASIAIFVAIIFSTLIALITKTSLVSLAVEGIGSSFGFNGGLQHKNYFAADILISFIGIYICQKKAFGRLAIINKVIMPIEIVFIILANARETYILFLFFLIYLIYMKLRFRTKLQKILFLLISIILFVGISAAAFKIILTKSNSYALRLQGLQNYLNVYSSNKFIMFFGNASMAFRNSGLSYVDNIRSVTGWNGTAELSLLSILVKNGLLGLMGYILIFTRYIILLMNIKNDSVEKKYAILIIILLLMSAFVENFIINIQIIFGMFCYMLITSFLAMALKKDNSNYKL